ncbi:hypothetical protein CO046_05175 [Candidatus Peregrinibacteria bacterium CG_4_9_14_0_2_um_filter_53_11]|nr:MAG: hypothetical protein CO046_05175 [Candidatus Peregrinibacteria bacterium CG_4_9_14_0_2_um_filter_53_11]
MNSTFFLIGIFLLAALLYLALTFYLRRGGLRAAQLRVIMRGWAEIQRTFSTNPKYALVEADKLLAYTLKQLGYSGSMGEVLKRRGDRLFSDLDGVWRVHKMRNRAVHEMHYEVTAKETTQALAVFRHALWDLGAEVR